jgi:hypothetical protein
MMIVPVSLALLFGRVRTGTAGAPPPPPPPAVSTLTLRGTNNDVGPATTIALPAGSQAGDLAILFDRAANSSGSPTSAIPTGFTNLVEDALNTQRVICSYGVLTSTDISNGTLAGMSGTSSTRKTVLVFQPDNPIASIVASTPNHETTNANPAAQTVTAAGVATPLVVVAHYVAGSGATPISGDSFSPAADGSVSNSNNAQKVAYKVYNASAANVSIDMGDLGSTNCLQSFYLRAA